MLCQRNIDILNIATFMQKAPMIGVGAFCMKENEVGSYTEKRIGKEV